METLLRLAAFVLSVWISCKFIGGYWVVGPVFAAVVAVYDRKAFAKDASRHVAYLIASTLIWAAVFYIAKNMRWGNGPLFQYGIGAFPAAVVLGSILLPQAHRILLKADAKLAIHTTLALIVSYYLVSFAAYANDDLGIGPKIQWLPVLVGVWQGNYLWGFFRRQS